MHKLHKIQFAYLASKSTITALYILVGKAINTLNNKKIRLTAFRDRNVLPHLILQPIVTFWFYLVIIKSMV